MNNAQEDAEREYPVPMKFRGVLPERLKDRLNENDPEVWDAASGWLAQFPRWHVGIHDGLGITRPHELSGHGLVLFGPPGTGKTMLACSFLNAVKAQWRHRGAFIYESKLSSLLRDYSDEAEYVVGGLERIACAVVDDVGRAGTDPASKVEMFLRAREDNGQPTIVTINNSVELPPTYASFLSTWTWAHFTGDDLRVTSGAR